MTRAALLLLVLCGIAHASEAPVIRTHNGRLTVDNPPLTGTWESRDNAECGGFYDGRVYLTVGPGRIELGGWRNSWRDWAFYSVVIVQTPGEVRAEYILRTPNDLPDALFLASEPDLTLLLIRHPEIVVLYGEFLQQIGSPPFAFDAAVSAQVSPRDWTCPPGIVAAVARLLPVLDSPRYHDRAGAESELADLGRDGALYLLLKLDRHRLSPPAKPVHRQRDSPLAGADRGGSGVVSGETLNTLVFAIIGHLVGDYLVQNDWLANGKKKSSLICAAHCLLWTLAVMTFAGLQWDHLWVFAVLFVTHFIQDRGPLVRKYMHLMGQDGFAGPPLGPWSIIAVDNVWHLVTLAIVARIIG